MFRREHQLLQHVNNRAKRYRNKQGRKIGSKSKSLLGCSERPLMAITPLSLLAHTATNLTAHRHLPRFAHLIFLALSWFLWPFAHTRHQTAPFFFFLVSVAVWRETGELYMPTLTCSPSAKNNTQLLRCPMPAVPHPGRSGLHSVDIGKQTPFWGPPTPSRPSYLFPSWLCAQPSSQRSSGGIECFLIYFARLGSRQESRAPLVQGNVSSARARGSLTEAWLPPLPRAPVLERPCFLRKVFGN